MKADDYSKVHLDEAAQFEQDVERVLRLSGLDVSSEQLVAYKKVDRLATEKTVTGTRRIAVECKCYARRLTQENVSLIIANYQTLYDTKQIDELLLVTLNGLSPSAEAMVSASRIIKHKTLAELQNGILDFDAYLQGAMSQYSDDGLARYYVPLRVQIDIALEALVAYWLDAWEAFYQPNGEPCTYFKFDHGYDNWYGHGPVLPLTTEESIRFIAQHKESVVPGKPLAILGSYGMGKTSFSRHIFYKLAVCAVQGVVNRIPIYIPLGDISSEQDLEGLLGKIFTTSTVVRNYTFGNFMSMNDAGRFVIILDGFDEMKHSLPWDAFRYNFKQLNRLVTANSRVILLGRPTAFLNDIEHRHALHGVSLVGGVEMRESDWPDYQEFYIEPFDRHRVGLFMERFHTFKGHGAREELAYLHEHERLRERIEELSGKYIQDIVQRPVQLRMLADILPSWNKPVDELTVAILYDHFIQKIIERETDKQARRKFSVLQRHHFARDIAWYLWVDANKNTITPEMIPDSLVARYISKQEDISSARRDLVSACFLDRKPEGSLFFPHRSFQEFLVAEKIQEGLSSGDITLSQAVSIANHEILEFLNYLIGAGEAKEWEPALERYSGVLPWRILRLWMPTSDGADEIRHLADKAKKSNCPWYTLLLTLGIVTGRLKMPDGFLDTIRKKRAFAAKPEIRLFYHFCTSLICAWAIRSKSHLPVHELMEESMLDLCFGSLDASIDARWGIDEKRRELPRVIYQMRQQSSSARARGVLATVLHKIAVNRQKRRVDFSASYRPLTAVLSPVCFLEDWLAGETMTLNSDVGERLERIKIPSAQYHLSYGAVEHFYSWCEFEES